MQTAHFETRPCEIRIKEHGYGAFVTAIFANVSDVNKRLVTNWRKYLAEKGWLDIPRVME